MGDREQSAESATPYKGDFAMLNPFPILRDEDGQFHCPMPILSRSWLDDGDETKTERAMCGEPLCVEWHVTCPVPDYDAYDEADRYITHELAGAWAHYSWWELKCANGHVLMTSRDDLSADDTAKPFVTAEVFGVPHFDGSATP